jgi:FMN-dependent NADH-azoreductase
MANLLHIDASIRGDLSVSRQVSAAFAAHWKQTNPDGGYIYRDLAAHPVPPPDMAVVVADAVPEEHHDAEQRAAWAVTKPLLDELVWADVLLIGSPMYNFTIPATLKAWIDRVTLRRFFADEQTGIGPLSGTKVVVVTARGGSYAEGSPRAGWDFQEPYLRKLFRYLGMHHDLAFVHAEMTLANVVPQLAQFKDLAAQSLAAAHRDVRQLAEAARAA